MRHETLQCLSAVVLGVICTLDWTTVAAVPFFTGIGVLPNSVEQSVTGFYGDSISDDGLVVVGGSRSDPGTQAFRWTAAGGMAGLGRLAPDDLSSIANGTSGDGSVVVGYGGNGSFDAHGREAFRWTAAGGMEALGDLAGGIVFSEAHAISADGSVVVGYSSSGVIGGGGEAFRWTGSTGMIGLGSLSSGGASRAYGTSADGAVVVGSAAINSFQTEAFSWTDSGGMVGLGDLSGGEFKSLAFAVSSDASVTVGVSVSGNGTEAFRWTDSGGMAGLGDLAGGNFFSQAFGTSADGSVVVGKSKTNRATDAGDTAFYWDAVTGTMVSVRQLLTGLGLAADLDDWALISATGVSADGLTITGFGRRNSNNQIEAWIAHVSPSVPEPATLALLGLGLVGIGFSRRKAKHHVYQDMRKMHQHIARQFHTAMIPRGDVAHDGAAPM